MLAHVAGSVSTDLNVWERMANPCVSQADCHSATTASVVWLLALDFIFTLCVSCPGILILDVVQTRSFLDWSHTGAFNFSRVCINIGLGGRGGSSLNLIQALESIVILDSWVYLLSMYKPHANLVQTSNLWGRTMPACRCPELRFDWGLYIWKHSRSRVRSWHGFLQ